MTSQALELSRILDEALPRLLSVFDNIETPVGPGIDEVKSMMATRFTLLQELVERLLETAPIAVKMGFLSQVEAIITRQFLRSLLGKKERG